MIIRSLRVENIRSHRGFNGTFSDNTTVIIGKNGCGKTTLLEAISVGLRGKSFKGSDREMLKTGEDWWKIDLVLDNQDRTIKYQPTRSTGQKQFIVDNKTTARLPKVARYPYVLFEPDDLRLLHGSPSRRRRFVDDLISQINPEYHQVALRYEKILQQRNRLLKEKNIDDSGFFAWNVSLAKYGSIIIQSRKDIIEQINNSLESVYKKIAKTDDALSISYPHSTSGNIEQRMLAELERAIERDRIIGNTSIGPHRHDIDFYFNNMPAGDSASRGETRTIILALKFIEVGLIEEFVDEKPIILLDDVFSELDETRQTHLASSFKDNQIIMTSVSVPGKLPGAKIIRLGTNK